jgi:cytochrome c oxidase cbb3-type subunit 3
VTPPGADRFFLQLRKHALSIDDPHLDDDSPVSLDPAAASWVLLGMLSLFLAGAAAYYGLRTPPVPPPAAVASDPLLLEGRTIYLARCATCHGVEGRGDGPIASNLLGPPVGNISDGKWKHGENSEDVMRVISKGIPETRMTGWGQLLEPSQIRAVTAYVFYLARQPVPPELRSPSA